MKPLHLVEHPVARLIVVLISVVAAKRHRSAKMAVTSTGSASTTMIEARTGELYHPCWVKKGAGMSVVSAVRDGDTVGDVVCDVEAMCCCNCTWSQTGIGLN